MPRDVEHLRRLYGEPPRPEPARLTFGVVPALWLIGLLLMAVGSAVLGFGSLWLAVVSAPSELERWGVIEPGEEELLVVRDEASTSGCVVTPGRIVRFEGHEAAGELSREDLTLSREGSEIVLSRSGSDRTLRCPASEGFADALGEATWR